MTHHEHEPHYGQPSGQKPEYAMDAEEHDGTEVRNEDLHGEAREVQEHASGEGPAETPGGG